jgi:FAD:protein FMN transferase
VTAPAAFGSGYGPPVDHAFRAMGCELRLAVVPLPDGDADAAPAVARATQLIHGADLALSRFDPASELRRLDASPLPTVTVSRLLALAVDHARHSAERSGGLLDPTLVADLERAGYPSDWDPARRRPLAELLAAAPRSAPAHGHREAAWRQISVDRETRTISRPPGMRLDLGATAKGLVADLALRMLGAADLAIVDLAGDLAIGGARLDREPLQILAADPFDRASLELELRGPGGVATSSIAGRCWVDERGPAHHLLDPATGLPAFTGLVQVTAAAPTAADAEILAGHALLAGPAAAAELLREFGGVAVHADGTTSILHGALLASGGAA